MALSTNAIIGLSIGAGVLLLNACILTGWLLFRRAGRRQQQQPAHTKTPSTTPLLEATTPATASFFGSVAMRPISRAHSPHPYAPAESDPEKASLDELDIEPVLARPAKFLEPAGTPPGTPLLTARELRRVLSLDEHAPLPLPAAPTVAVTPAPAPALPHAEHAPQQYGFLSRAPTASASSHRTKAPSRGRSARSTRTAKSARSARSARTALSRMHSLADTASVYSALSAPLDQHDELLRGADSDSGSEFGGSDDGEWDGYDDLDLAPIPEGDSDAGSVASRGSLGHVRPLPSPPLLPPGLSRSPGLTPAEPSFPRTPSPPLSPPLRYSAPPLVAETPDFGASPTEETWDRARDALLVRVAKPSAALGAQTLPARSHWRRIDALPPMLLPGPYAARRASSGAGA